MEPIGFEEERKNIDERVHIYYKIIILVNRSPTLEFSMKKGLR